MNDVAILQTQVLIMKCMTFNKELPVELIKLLNIQINYIEARIRASM